MTIFINKNNCELFFLLIFHSHLNKRTAKAVNDMAKTKKFEQKWFFELFDRLSIRSGFCSNVVYPGPCMFSDEIDPNPSCSELSSIKLSSTFCRSVFCRRRFFTFFRSSSVSMFSTSFPLSVVVDRGLSVLETTEKQSMFYICHTLSPPTFVCSARVKGSFIMT